MGCVASKLEEEEQVVSICRERKRKLKLAVERRYALADAHCRYCKSLEGVAAAINLFVTRHSPPSQPFPITFPSPKQNGTSNSNPLFLQQTPSSGPTQPAPESCGSSTTSDSSQENIQENQETEENLCGYYNNYMGTQMQMPVSMQIPPPPPSMPSPQRDFGWDFFDPFAGYRPEMMTGYDRSSDDDLRVVREEEGIPELEEEEEGEKLEQENNKVKVVVEEKQSGETEKEQSGVEVVRTGEGANVSQGEQKGLTVIDTPVRGRELLEALKDIEDYFIRAFDSGKELSRMLEANRVHLQSGLEEIKG